MWGHPNLFPGTWTAEMSWRPFLTPTFQSHGWNQRPSYPNLLWVISLSSVSNSCHLKHPNLWVYTSDKWLLQHCTCENPPTSWELRTLTPAVTFNPSLWTARESQLSNWELAKLRKSSSSQLGRLGTQLPRHLLQQTSLLFKGDLAESMEKTEFIHFPWQRSSKQAPLAIMVSLDEGKLSSCQIQTMWQFHQLGIPL